MDAQFVEPTRAGRIKLAMFVLAGLLVSAAMHTWWHPFMGYVQSLPICEQLPWLRGIVLTFIAISWLVGIAAVRAARLTLVSGQSPFPGAWVWSRTKLRTGWKARLDGCAFALYSTICFAGPVVAAYGLKAHEIFCHPASCGC
jgi:hypothetical protein